MRDSTRSMATTHSPPRRGGEDAPSEAKAQTGWSDRRNVAVELTTPALRATPPLRGGECFGLASFTISTYRVFFSLRLRYTASTKCAVTPVLRPYRGS